MNTTYDERAYHYNISGLLSKIENVEGCVIELGVAAGKNTINIGRLLKSQKKKYYGFDTFSGYTQEDIDAAQNHKESLIKIQKSGRWVIDSSMVLRKIAMADLSQTCEIIVGDIKQTVPQFIERNLDLKIAMVYIDCNAYLPTITALNSVKNNLSDDALIVVDEHRQGGETRAFLEFMPSAKMYNVADTFLQGLNFYGIWKNSSQKALENREI